jgi:hypothetical protein
MLILGGLHERATWNSNKKSAQALRARKNTKNLNRLGRSHNLPGLNIKYSIHMSKKNTTLLHYKDLLFNTVS